MPGRTPKKRPAAGPAPAAEDVQAHLARLDHPLKREVLAIRKIIRGVDPRIAESVKWNAPSFSTSEHFATFQLRDTRSVLLVLHLGAKPPAGASVRGRIADPSGLLQWRGPDRATVSFRDLRDVQAKEAALADLIRQWITFVR